ncbi:MAG: exonuclease subunit SbcD, partial [Candidatus Altiarchaeota archaeon]|nr:exonuclease subunit SbcD [Candidatus Altiarchaeota archaeon]
MRIGFTSDFHLGFGVGKRRGEAARQAKRAMQTLKQQKVDLIVNTGDVFDT